MNKKVFRELIKTEKKIKNSWTGKTACESELLLSDLH